jgi:membrane protease YdiL (CAAX protease family)
MNEEKPLLRLAKPLLLYLLVTNTFLAWLLRRAGWSELMTQSFCALAVFAAVVALLRVWRRESALSWRDMGLSRSPDARAWAIGAAAGFVSLGAHLALSKFVNLDSSANALGRLSTASTAQLAPLVLLNAAAEELFFRGLLLAVLRRRFGAVRAVLASAAVFSAYHVSLTNSLHHFATGLIYGAVAVGTGSLYPVILGHFLHNMMVFRG